MRRRVRLDPIITHAVLPIWIEGSIAGKGDQMPRVKLTKSVIEALPTPPKDVVYWDSGCPGFGVKITPRGRKVFVVLYRTAGARLRKYTVGPYGRVTLNQARVTAQKVFAAKLDGRDLAAEKKDSRRRMVADRVWRSAGGFYRPAPFSKPFGTGNLSNASAGDRISVGQSQHS